MNNSTSKAEIVRRGPFSADDELPNVEQPGDELITLLPKTNNHLGYRNKAMVVAAGEGSVTVTLWVYDADILVWAAISDATEAPAGMATVIDVELPKNMYLFAQLTTAGEDVTAVSVRIV